MKEWDMPEFSRHTKGKWFPDIVATIYAEPQPANEEHPEYIALIDQWKFDNHRLLYLQADGKAQYTLWEPEYPGKNPPDWRNFIITLDDFSKDFRKEFYNAIAEKEKDEMDSEYTESRVGK